ncbi:MAG: hypothetical protein U0167_14085 [bacterium]
MPEVYARTLVLKPHDASLAPRLGFLAALKEWLAGRWPAERELTSEEPATVEDGRGGVFRWEPFEGPEGILDELSWRRPDEIAASRSWSTQVAFVQTSCGARAVIRVACSDPSPGAAGAPRVTRPDLVLSLHDRFDCSVDGVPSRRRVAYLSAEDFPRFVRYILLDPERTDPVLLLTPLASGEFPLSPSRLQDEFLTLGTLYVTRLPEDTFALSDELGRRELSCFLGALRAYMPGFRLSDDPFTHPLLVARRVVIAPVRAALAGILAADTVGRSRDDPEIGRLRDLRAADFERTRAAARRALEHQAQAARERAEWEEIAKSYAEENAALREEVGALKERLRDANERLQHSERIGGASQAGRTGGGERFEHLQPHSVLEAVETAAALLEADLEFLPSAHESAAASPYARPAEILAALRAMSDVAAAKRAGPLGKTLAEAFREKGLDYRRGISKGTPKRLRQQFTFRSQRGEETCEEHLCLGAAYDPAECARIYFTTEGPDGRFVIGHVGRHLKVMSTT